MSNFPSIVLGARLNIIVLLSFYSFIFAKDSIVVNTNIDLSTLKSIFVVTDVNLPTQAPLYDSLKTVDFWNQMYETLLLEHNFNVISRSKINSLIEEYNLSLTGLTNDKATYKIGKLISADVILFVDIVESSDSTVYETFRLIKVATGEIVFTGVVTYKPRLKYAKGTHPSDKREQLFKIFDRKVKESGGNSQ